MKKFNIGYHAKVMLSGFLNVLYGAGTAALAGMSVYGFISIPSEGGYIAVADFICAIATMCVAISCMYAQGRGKRKGDNHKRK